MGWQIEWSPQAFKTLKSLPPDIQQRILKRVDLLQDNPFHFLEHFSGRFYKFRIGDYRALIEIDFGGKVINIQVFDHRKRIYKRLR